MPSVTLEYSLYEWRAVLHVKRVVPVPPTGDPGAAEPHVPLGTWSALHGPELVTISPLTATITIATSSFQNPPHLHRSLRYFYHSMAADAFRSQMNSLGWSRREEPVNTSTSSPLLSRLQSLNPFSDTGYVRLPTTNSDAMPTQLPARTRQEEEAGWFASASPRHHHPPALHSLPSMSSYLATVAIEG